MPPDLGLLEPTIEPKPHKKNLTAKPHNKAPQLRERARHTHCLDYHAALTTNINRHSSTDNATARVGT